MAKANPEEILPRIRTPGPVKVWKVVEGLKMDGSGESIKFSIQEVPEDRYEDILEHMATNFIADEPMTRSLKGKDDPVFVADLKRIWRYLLNQGVTVAAFVEDKSGGKPIIAGCNMLGVEFQKRKAELKDFDIRSEKARKLLQAVMGITAEVDGYEKYQVDRYMFAFGLSVDPRFRGQSLGAHLLKAREDIGREYKIPMTMTAFTSPISQKLAERVGFETHLERDYADIVDEEGNLVVPDIKVKSMKIMAKRLY